MSLTSSRSAIFACVLCWISGGIPASAQIGESVENPQRISGLIVTPAQDPRFLESAVLPESSPAPKDFGQFTVVDLDDDLRGEIVLFDRARSVWVGRLGSSSNLVFSKNESSPDYDDRSLLLGGTFGPEGDVRVLALDLFKGHYSVGNLSDQSFLTFEKPKPLPFAGRETKTVLAGDVDGDGADDLVRIGNNGTSELWRNINGGSFERSKTLAAVNDFSLVAWGNPAGTGNPLPFVVYTGDKSQLAVYTGLDALQGRHRGPWAQFRRVSAVPPYTFGDFNADGRTDLLVYRGIGLNWWIAFSIGDSALEIAIAGLPVVDAGRIVFAAGDVDGDGADDTVIYDRPSGNWKVFSSRLVAGLSGAVLRNGTAAAANTDAGGRFSFQGQIEAIRPELAGYEFAQTLKRARSRNKSPLAEVRYFAVPDQAAVKQNNLPIGQAVRVGPDASGPYVCLGYNPASAEKWGAPYGRCPEGYALYAAHERSGSVPGPEHVYPNGACCRLPAPDILGTKEVEAAVECPAEYVGIGASGEYNVAKKSFLICREINTERYQLGPIVEGLYRGIGSSLRAYSAVLPDEDLPEALRYGATRLNESQLLIDGCVGSPFGSLLVRKGKYCSDQGYRQLQYRGRPEDPRQGTPVKMFPECSRIKNWFDPTSGCYPAPESSTALSSKSTVGR